MEIISIMDSYPETTNNTPVNKVYIDNSRTMITYQMKTRTLRSGALYFGEDWVGFSHKDMGTHSLQSEFSVELFLSWKYPETIMIMGICSRNAFLCYMHIHVINTTKEISAIMISTHNFYTIIEVGVISYNPGQSGTHIYRIHPNRGNTKSNNEYFLLMH